MLEVNPMKINSSEVESLIKVTEQFLEFADTLFDKGELSADEHNNITVNKREFIKDVKSKYI